MKYRTKKEEQELKELKQDIKEMKGLSFEQMYLVTIYSLSNYLKSLMAFGRKSNITKDNLNIIKEMFEILKTERTLLNYILKNIDIIDIYSAVNVIGLLDSLNDETVNYYYDVMGDIEDACSVGQEYRGIRGKKNFPTLIQDTCYAQEVVALCENLDSLKLFLGYEEEFWIYLENKIKYVHTDINIEKKACYAIPIYDDRDIVVDLDLLVPEVVDLETALLALTQYAKTYRIFKCFGKKYEETSQKEIDTLTNNYRKVYLHQKAQGITK